MTVQHGATLDDYVLARHLPVAAFLVLTALDADGIVADVKGGVSDYGPVARLQIQSVAVLRIPGIADSDVVQGHILTLQRVNVPRRRVAERGILQQHTLAQAELQQHGALQDPALVGLSVGTLQLIILRIGIPHVLYLYARTRCEGLPLVFRELTLL